MRLHKEDENGFIHTIGYVSKKIWGPDDDYLVVDEFQVFEEDGFKIQDKIEIFF